MSENTEPGNESLAIDFQKILDLYEELKCSTVPTNDAQFQVTLVYQNFIFSKQSILFNRKK